MFKFKLPDIGEGLHEAELLAWDVKVGERVEEGQAIAQISTDKVNVELPAPRAGVIAELPWQPGDVIAVGKVLAVIDTGDSSSGMDTGDDSSEKPRSTSAVSRAERTRVVAAPAVRRYAAEKGVDLADVAAGGPVTAADIDAYLSGDSAPAPKAEPGVTLRKLSGARLAAARRLETSWRTLATTAIAFEVRGEAIEAEIARLTNEQENLRITPVSVVAHGLCKALAQHPEFNARVDDEHDTLALHQPVHLGVAVDSEDGLLVPVIRDAQKLSTVETAAAIEFLAQRARCGALEAGDYRGSTFTLSSTGSLEKATITATTPIINFPNVATLWISAISQQPVVEDQQLTVGSLMRCTLAFDHRYLHGADAVRFINTLDACLRNVGEVG